MNASSWKKAADFVAKMTPVIPQGSAAAMAEITKSAEPPVKCIINR